MGTATFIIQHTRSQSRKTRSASRGEAKDRELSSPLQFIHSNVLTPSSKRQCLRITNTPTDAKQSDKENAIPSTTGLQDASQVLESEGAAKAIKKRTESGTAASLSKRHRSKSGNTKDDNETPAKGSSSAPASNECENGDEEPSTGLLAACASHGSLNQKATCVASSSVNRTNLGTMPSIDTGFCTRLSQENCNVRPSLAMRDSTSPVETNGERKSCADCTVNERHEVPSVHSLAGVLAPPVGTNGERELPAGCTVIARTHKTPSLCRQPEIDSKDKDTLQITDFDQNIGSSLPDTSPLLLLKKDYEKLYQKYRKLKARRIDEVDALFEDQNLRITAYIKATEALMEHYKRENNLLTHQIQDASIPDILNRCRWLEKANVEYRNDLLLEQSKNLELQQEILSLKSLFVECAAGKPRHSALGSKLTPEEQEDFATDIKKIEDKTNRKTDNDTGPVLRTQTKLMQQLLEGLLGLKLSFSDDGIGTQLQFQHGPTGFSFNLESVQDLEIAHLVGGGELMYQNVSSGTLCRKAVDWMKEDEIIFGINQVQFLFKKLLRFFQQGDR